MSVSKKARLLILLSSLLIVFTCCMGHVPANAQEDFGKLSASGNQYTIGWISDTQYYSAKYPSTFKKMTGFLKKNQDMLKLEYIVHTGDFVQKSTDLAQWKNAYAAMLSIAGIPQGVLAGNHDVYGDVGYRNFNKYFGSERYSQYDYYGGNFLDNRNHYDLMTIGKTDYIFVYLGYSPGPNCRAWARDVFNKYPDRVGVLCLHKYMDSNTLLNDTGKTIRREVVSKCPNVYMVLCGHRYNDDCVPVKYDDDGDGRKERTVYQCISNFQALPNGGNGYIRFVKIDEDRGMMYFNTYSPVIKKYLKISKKAVTKSNALPLPWLVAKSKTG